ncbi:MAG TPA: type II secretion system protein [Burkholderiales bacterium]|nr:type II secretion system protein [Burkholderiales bacterium]
MNPSRGFTLAELAVAVAIIGLLLAGALIPFSTQIDVRNTADTQRAMESVREAIIGFAQANGRLPCPADGSIAAGLANAGTEQFNGTSCTASLGVVPWATLGAPETDAWGRRFSYRVSPVFADISASTWATTTPPSPANQSLPCAPTPLPTPPTTFALCSLGDIAVFTRGSTTAAVPMGSALPAIIISHGKNGGGAWQTNGIRLNPIPTGNDEAANINGGNPTATPSGGYPSWAFYSRTPTPAASGCVDPIPGGPASSAPLCEFDDIVVVISSSTLIARMVAAGRLP